MESSFADQPGKKSAFAFCNGYLTVIYGLLVTDGLQYVVAFSRDPNNKWNPLNAFLFLGAFLTSIHYWFACATIDDLSQDFYRILAGKENPYFDLLLLFDALVATAFAGFVLAMFHAIPPERTRFFLWFFWAAGLSLFYDFYSCILVSYARRVHEEKHGQGTIQRNGEKVTNLDQGRLCFCHWFFCNLFPPSASRRSVFHCLRVRVRSVYHRSFAHGCRVLDLSEASQWFESPH